MDYLVVNQQIPIQFPNEIILYIKREDLIHPFIPGNKYRKLKYNLLKAKEEKKTKLLTFGGAFSNHIAAVAYAGKENNFKTIGIIRGDELASQISENPTLQFAQGCGMKFQFVTREEYKNKTADLFIEKLKKLYGDFYLIPEGGTNLLAVKGCEEVLKTEDAAFSHICCAIGTGGTISGLINSANFNQKIIGFPALKGNFLSDDIRKFATNSNWELQLDYHFGGYAKINEELIRFINDFFKQTNIPLDPIYTGKMMFGILDLINKGYFPKGAKILAIHSGGLQGIKGMNSYLKKKNLNQIIIQ
ncbi:MAG: 1-aminocyclopropane-1-carboxylate deaminase/D-cysteine desulfhydrase [Flavobacteriaceae bacterium]|nr:1-aminocyclopropane-1-carboxylate deaminase/D-cysteine desulfhydrase [Flavobacteriaceae bacterium]